MKRFIYLINPMADFPTYFGGDVFAANGFPRLVYFADLVIPTLAAFVPDAWTIRLCDENLDAIDYATDADFVGITGKISQFGRMKEIAAEFRKRGKTVLIGGPYASLVPEQVRPHCDILVRGEIENIAGQLFSDLESGHWQNEYFGSQPDLTSSPVPRWDLYPNDRAFIGVVQTSRGCPFICEYCDVIVYAGRKQRFKTPEQITRELDVLYAHGYRNIFLADDNFTADKRRARELLLVLEAWNRRQRHGKVNFATQLSIEAADDDRLLALCSKAGLLTAYIGIETPNLESLRQAKKPQNLRGDLLEQIDAFLAHGIRVIAGMIVGFDADTADIFEQHYDFAMASAVPFFTLSALVAPEGTPLYARLLLADRLIANGAQIGLVPWDTNIVHPNLTEEQLALGRRWLGNRLYSPDAFCERLLKFIDKLAVRKTDAGNESRPIERNMSELLARLPGMGLGESRMVSRIEAALRTRPDAAGFVYDTLYAYMQIRYVYSTGNFWDPALGAMLIPPLTKSGKIEASSR